MQVKEKVSNLNCVTRVSLKKLQYPTHQFILVVDCNVLDAEDVGMVYQPGGGLFVVV